jgi:Putative zinc-finger
MNDTWHVPAETMSAWVSGRISPTVAASVEHHLMTCASCRSQVAAPVADQVPLDYERVWAGIADRVEPPSLRPLGKMMNRLGMSESDAILLGATSAFTVSWVAATAAVVGLTFLMSVVAPVTALPIYLLLAPLVPMAGVAAAYGEEVDPAYELGIAAPYPQLRVLLLRAVAVVVVSVPLTVVAGAGLRPWWVAVAWLAPGLAFVLLLLAATTWWSPADAAAAIALVWTVASVATYRLDQILVLVGPGSISVSVLLGVVGAATLLLRREALLRRLRIFR